MMPIPTNWLVALTTVLALGGCVPNPPEAEPPEVEVSGGELPEYDHHQAALDEDEDDDDALTLDLDLDVDDDLDVKERSIEG